MATNLVPIRSTQPSPNTPSLASSAYLTMGQTLSPVRRMSMPGGDRGTEFTVSKIRELVHQGMTDQLINRQAMAIVHAAGVQAFDFVGEIRVVFDWVRRNIRFFKDIDGVETLRTAREILTIRGGDCDDINAVLLPSLLLTIGHSVRLVTISSDADAPGVFSHIYCEVEMGGQWVPLDAARRDPAFGKGPRNYFRKRIWSLTENRYRDVSGLGSYYAQGRTRSGRRQMRRLGDFSDILDSIAPVIQDVGTATASIINATNGGIRANIPGFAVGPNGQLVPIGPQGQLVVSSAPGGVFAAGAGSIPNWLIYGAMGLGGILLLQAVRK
jgi:hypothetical protein